MLDWFEGRRRWPLAALAVLLLILMMASEALNNDEPIWSVDQLFDFANALLLVGTTVACTLLALRLGARSDRRSGASSTLGA